MNLRTLVLCSVLVLAGTLFAREKSDVMVMTNGDRLTCEIKALEAGVLYVSLDYILGTSSVQWSKVDHLESKQLFIVKTGNGLVYTGTLSAAQLQGERPVKIEVTSGPEKKVELERAQVVQMEPTSQKFLQRFNGDINLGFIYSKANQSAQFSLTSAVQYPRERWSAQASYSSILASSTGANASTRNQIDYNAQRLLPWNNWYYSGLGVFLQSSEQEIDLQTTLGAGIGRYLKNTNNAKITLLGGVAWQNTAYRTSTLPQGNQSLADAVVAGDMRFFRFNKTSLDVNAMVLPALSQPGRVHINTNAAYYIKVFSNLTWNISFYGNWDNQPPANFSGSDYGTSLGLGWTFGNR